ncbi:hypothetical protein D3C86_2096250 [compost metagenome]
MVVADPGHERAYGERSEHERQSDRSPPCQIHHGNRAEFMKADDLRHLDDQRGHRLGCDEGTAHEAERQKGRHAKRPGGEE